MELVLGVSMTATTIRAALVEGEKADGVIVDHDVFDITAVDGSATPRASDEVIATILGTQESAIDAGHHLVSIGVTWMDRTEAAASTGGIGRPWPRRRAAGFGVARRRRSGAGGRPGGGLRQDRPDVRRARDRHAGGGRNRRWLGREGPARKSAWRRRNRRGGRHGQRFQHRGITGPGPVGRWLRHRCRRGQGTCDRPRRGARHRP